MSDDTWEKLGAVFHRAVEVPAADRAAWLDRECGNDHRLRAEVEAMLVAHGAGGSEDPEHLLGSGARLGPGDRIGIYRLEALIGRGGMGEVYRAHREDDQYRQQVAVKLVRAERSSPELVRRFVQERQILAQLTHPNIATLLDGGLTPQGVPYLVMQFVQGEPLTKYAATHGLGLEDRLRLFVTVCDAVQFAHQHLVVHRDIKPANILVGPDGQPRLLDFGIAKLLDPAAAVSTTGDLLLLTPEHAAPEQFLGAPVTTATDVYALGVLLYELLTGTRPFRDVPAAELARVVCEEPPPRPGAIRPVANDLEQIVLMALRKEPARRYRSAGALGLDVERFLGGWPVTARPDTAGYRFQRFVGRHRAAVAAAAVVGVTLIGATAAIARQSAARAAALGVATAQRDRAERLTDFLLNVFRSTNPNEARGRTVTAQELLDRAAVRIRSDLRSDTATRADMLYAIGRAHGLLGLNRTADTLLAAAVDLRRAARPVDSAALATSLEGHARTVLTMGRLPEGVGQLREVIALRERLLGPNAPAVAQVLRLLATAANQLDPTDRDSTAHRSLARALAIYRAADSAPTRDVVEVLRAQAVLAEDAGRLDDALAIMEDAVRETEAGTDADDPFRFVVYETYALYLGGTGKLDSAIAIHRRNLKERRRVFGPDHPDVSFSLFNLGRSLAETRRLAEADSVFTECIALRRRVFGPDHLQTGFAVGQLARVTAAAGDLTAALGQFDEARRIVVAAVGPRHPSVLDYDEAIALVQVRQGRLGEAVRTLERAVANGYARLDRPEWAALEGLAGFRTLKAGR
ncbi:MAG: protein kinase [Gemmatimonadales bacterium]